MAHKLKTGTPKAVAAAGTAEALSATSKVASSIILQADKDNTGNIYVGDSTVDSTNGIVLEAGQSVELVGDVRHGGGDEYDLAEVFIDSDTNGESVRILYSGKK